MLSYKIVYYLFLHLTILSFYIHVCKLKLLGYSIFSILVFSSKRKKIYNIKKLVGFKNI